MDDAEGQSAVPASSGAPAATGAPDALQWTQAVQQWQAQAQAMQGNQQRKNGAQAPPPFYPLGAAHPYSLYQVGSRSCWEYVRFCAGIFEWLAFRRFLCPRSP